MKRLGLQLSFLVVLCAIYSFTPVSNSSIYGVYGVSENDPSSIELTINKDQTFSFIDNSNPNKQINVSGKWEQKGRYIVLENDEYAHSFHQKWRVVKNGEVAKSRKGMTFYTISKK